MTQAYQPVVLVIDPDALTLMGLSATLHHEKMEVHGARTPIAALKAAESLPIDIVICDSWVATDGGKDLILKLRDFSHLSDVPVICLTDALTAAGNDAASIGQRITLLRKPINLEAFVETVKKTLWLPHLVHSQMTLRPHSFSRNRSKRSKTSS